MIDRKQLDNHPASRFARGCLKAAHVPEWGPTPLLELVLAYLDSLPPEAFKGENNYLDDLKTEAFKLTSEPPGWAACLMVADYETLEREVEEQPGQEWQVLAGHLDGLLEQLRPAQSVREAGKILAENLMASLGHVHPSFGPQRG